MSSLREGHMLSARLASAGVSVTEAIEIGAQIAECLAAAHAAGLVYGQLHSANVVLLADPAMPLGIRAQLLDLGTGAPAYMAPEQLASTREPVDARADLYALGVLLFEATTGRPPFLGATLVELIGQHLCDPVPRPRSLDTRIPRALDELIVCLLAKRRDARPQSAAAVEIVLRAMRLESDSRPCTIDDGADSAGDTLPAFSACA